MESAKVLPFVFDRAVLYRGGGWKGRQASFSFLLQESATVDYFFVKREGKRRSPPLLLQQDATAGARRAGRQARVVLQYISEVRLGVFFHFRTAASSFGAFLSFSEDDLLSRARRVSLSAPQDGNGKSYYVKLASRRLHHHHHRRPGSPATPLLPGAASCRTGLSITLC